VGFPGVVRDGRVLSATAFVCPTPGGLPDAELLGAWIGLDLRSALGNALAMPVRVENDADVHLLASATGAGVECALTLGTGVGLGVSQDGRLWPHLEVGSLPAPEGADYDATVGQLGLEAVGVEQWSRRVEELVAAVRLLTTADRVYVGGGNARLLEGKGLGTDVVIVSNVNGLLGAHLLWPTSD
jgi:polyphosphate glucokinase